MLRLAASKLLKSPLMGQAAGAGRTVISRQSNNGSDLVSATTSRRAFHGNANLLPEPELAPAETILLDLTGWFVAFALIYVPSSSAEPLEQTAESDRVHVKKDRFQSENKRVSSAGKGEEKDTKSASDHYR